MKKNIFFVLLIGAMILLATGLQAEAGELDVLVTHLIDKGVLTPAEGQTILDETKIRVSKDLEQGKSYSVPEWTQRIKWGGDVRFRTQGDWGKTTAAEGANTLREQRLRNRIRGRFYLEGRVNEFTYAGARFAGGGTNPRSPNDTIQDYFSKNPVEFDQYYIRMEASNELRREYGKYFSDAKLWLGKFTIPFESSELVWDSDINPSGVALQYVSPALQIPYMPDTKVYGNAGMLWLDEMVNINTDPILFGYQVGVKTDPFGPFNSQLNIGTAFYNFSNLKNKTPDVSAGTNSRVWAGDGFTGTTATNSIINSYKNEFNVFDLLIQLDNEKIMDWALPHGFYSDFIYNASVDSDENTNKGLLAGLYIGKKKLKEPKDYKLRAEWRYIERDSIPDFMPDSDFYGFGTFTANTTAALNAGNNGLPVEGGTNGKGVNMAFEYQLLKNTSLNLEYYWMKPIKSWDKHNPWNLVQFDISTKF